MSAFVSAPYLIVRCPTCGFAHLERLGPRVRALACLASADVPCIACERARTIAQANATDSEGDATWR